MPDSTAALNAPWHSGPLACMAEECDVEAAACDAAAQGVDPKAAHRHARRATRAARIVAEDARKLKDAGPPEYSPQIALAVRHTRDVAADARIVARSASAPSTDARRISLFATLASADMEGSQRGIQVLAIGGDPVAADAAYIDHMASTMRMLADALAADAKALKDAADSGAGTAAATLAGLEAGNQAIEKAADPAARAHLAAGLQYADDRDPMKEAHGK